ncbi:hypothetical protein F4808DRAFT_467547 [Astrocystis sublimbata]|nr:hypothetical protein F4808DRAFT_467547 [Astrocystis sublimbata]
MCCGSSSDYTADSSNDRGRSDVDGFLWGASYAQSDIWREEQEKREKQQRQAQARAAAERYGWRPTGGAYRSHGDPETSCARDSLIEPNLAHGFAAMPGSDFRPFYHSHQLRRQQTPHPSKPGQRPPNHDQRIVNQQPGRVAPMNAPPTKMPARKPLKGESRAEPRTAHQHPGARKPPMSETPLKVPPKSYVRVEPIPTMRGPSRKALPKAPHGNIVQASQLNQPLPALPQPLVYAQPRRIVRVESPVIRPYPVLPRKMPPVQRSSPEAMVVHRHPGIAHNVVVKKQPNPHREPEAAIFSIIQRRPSKDSNRISLCSSDNEWDDSYRKWTVSPESVIR